VTIDGVPIQSGDRARVERALVEARDIRTASNLRVRLGDWYALELAPGSHLSLSPIEQRSRLEPLFMQIDSGTLRVRTGPAFRGDVMRIDTDDVSVSVTGTTLGIDIVDDGTCVCCLNGSVKVTPARSKTSDTLTGEGTYHAYRAGGAPKKAAIVEKHAEPLRALDALARGLWP